MKLSKKVFFTLLCTLVLLSYSGTAHGLRGKKKVAVIGDSITEDGGYIKQLQRLCPDYVFHNYGVAGESTRKIIKRVKKLGSNLQKKVVGLWEYDELIVLAGVNNISEPKTVINDLQQIYKLAKENPYRDTRVIAVTLTPWKGYKTWNRKKQKNTELVNSFILGKPQSVDACINVYKPLEDPDNPKTLKYEFHLTNDKLHPRGKGQKVIGQTIYESAYNK
jgi:lysophospholipase L1-like esterase